MPIRSSGLVLVAVLCVTLTSCAQAYRDKMKGDLGVAMAKADFRPPSGVDPTSKLGRTHVYWQKLVLAMKVWNDERRDAPQWSYLSEFLRDLPTSDVDADAVSAGAVLRKAMDDGVAGGASAWSNSGGGNNDGGMQSFSAMAAAVKLIEAANGEVAGLRTKLQQRYAVDFPELKNNIRKP